MHKSPSYLVRNRHGTFYFRMVIPRPLRLTFNCQREIRRSLHTDSARTAIKRARQHAVRLELIFEKVMQLESHELLGMSKEEFEELYELHLSEQNHSAKRLLNSKPPTSQEIDDLLEEVKEQRLLAEVAKLLTGNSKSPIPESLQGLADELISLATPYTSRELPEALPRLRDAISLRALNSANSSAAQPIYQVSRNYDPAMEKWTLYKVWEHQLDRDRKDLGATGGQAKHSGTLEDRERLARVMTVLTSHAPVCKMSKHDWQSAYDLARKIKSGAKASINPPTPVSELITDTPEQLAGHERVGALISLMKQLQEHARFLDLTEIRADDLIIKPVEKRITRRSRDSTPFTDDDIENIFSGYIYRGDIPSDRKKAYPFWFWLPLVAYFTGARTNEIAQLDTKDIVYVDGTPCFDFCGDDPKTHEAKRIKTGESRQVPIHSALVKLGLLEFAKNQQRENQKKLFGEGLTYLRPRDSATDHNKEGWAKMAGKFFNEKPKGYLVAVGVHEPNDGKSIYSFRHTLITNLRNARRDGAAIDETTINAITGHTPEDIAGKHYDSGATIKQMLEALNHLPIPKAIEQLETYQTGFMTRFGEQLTKSIRTHRKKYPRPLQQA